MYYCYSNFFEDTETLRFLVTQYNSDIWMAFISSGNILLLCELLLLNYLDFFYTWGKNYSNLFSP